MIFCYLFIRIAGAVFYVNVAYGGTFYERKRNENSPFISTFPNSKGKNADKAQNGKRCASYLFKQMLFCDRIVFDVQ